VKRKNFSYLKFTPVIVTDNALRKSSFSYKIRDARETESHTTMLSSVLDGLRGSYESLMEVLVNTLIVNLEQAPMSFFNGIARGTVCSLHLTGNLEAMERKTKASLL